MSRLFATVYDGPRCRPPHCRTAPRGGTVELAFTNPPIATARR